MAKVMVSFSRSDIFSFSGGFGIVLSKTQALMITGEGGRTGYKRAKGSIPSDARPVEESQKLYRSEVRFALESIKDAIS